MIIQLFSMAKFIITSNYQKNLAEDKFICLRNRIPKCSCGILFYLVKIVLNILKVCGHLIFLIEKVDFSEPGVMGFFA